MNEPSIIIQELQSLGLWRGKVVIEPLAGGITNQNFLVEDETGRYVARICKELPLLGIDRRNEAACQETASRLGIAPALIHRDEGLLVSRYVAGQTLTSASLHDLAMIREIGRTLRRLHDGRDVVTGLVLYFCPFQTIRTYAQTAVALKARLPDDVDNLLDDTPPARESDRPVPARALPQRSAAGQYDHERGTTLAGRLGIRRHGPPPLRPCQRLGQRRLQRRPGGRPCWNPTRARSTAELDLIRVFKAASLLREALWAVIQTATSELDFDYHGYAASSFRGIPACKEHDQLTRPGGRHLLEGLQIRDQVGEVAASRAPRPGRWASARRRCACVLDVVLGIRTASRRRPRSRGLGGLALDDPGEDPAVGQGDDDRLVARGDPGRGVEDRRDQLVARVLGPDARELGADRAALPCPRRGT